jgi:membrane protein implicated in regulation of membrane protease activity
MVFWWFIAFLVFIFIELITVNLVTIWFAIGAIAAVVTTFFTDSIVIQSIVFVVVSVLSLLITKPLVKKFKKFDITPTNSDRVIGKIGEVTKKISSNKYGEVKVFESIWTAKSDEEIEVGKKVKVLSIEGVKLIVKKESE